MKRTPEKTIVWDDTRGGRNDTDPPLSLRDDQCVEMLNVDWKDTHFARKRGGAVAVSTSGGTAFTFRPDFLFRHLPSGAQSAAELWAWDADGAPLKRMAGGTAFADVTLDDAISTNVYDVIAASLNGKLFLAYDSAQDRLHVYDPNLSSARVRRVGFATPSAPTVADSAVGGAYPAVLRYYRVRWIQVSGSLLIRRSEPGASQSFTPNGAFTAAVITRPTAASEGETHWEVDVSLDNATWYGVFSWEQNTHVAIATTTASDSVATTDYSAYRLSDAAGTFGRFPSVKVILSDGNRLLGANAWESAGANSGGKTSRVWFTPVLGSLDKGDDERVVNTTTQKNWLDLNENDGGAVIALGGPLNGIVYAFKYRQVWRLRPTGDVAVPYVPRKIRDDIGTVHQRTLAIGEDQSGRPALYFYSHRGPYRITADGVAEYLGRDNEVTWRSVNLAASVVVSHSLYYPDLHQWWLWVAVDAGTAPTVKMVFDVQKGFPDQTGAIRGGWTKHTGNSASTTCSCLFANTPGASMSADLKPYVADSVGGVVLKCDTSDLDDNGTDFQAYVKSRPTQLVGDLRHKWGLAEPVMAAKALSGVTLTLTSDRDSGAETRTHTQLLTASGTETRVVKKFEGAEIGEANTIQLQIGDGSAQEGAWSIDGLVIPALRQEPR